MFDRRTLLAASAAWFSTAALTRHGQAQTPKPPIALRKPARSVHHGIEKIDDYAWLRDPNWRDVIQDPSRLQPDIRAYVDAENAYADAALAPLQNLKATILAELRGRVEQAYGTVPSRDGVYHYWTRYEAGAEHAQYVRAPALDAPVEVLLDVDRLAKGQAYLSAGEIMHSPDHLRLGYLIDTRGSEAHDLYIRPIKDDGRSPVTIPNVADFVWAADSRSIVYVRRDDELRPRLVYLHRLGTDPKDDVKLYEEADVLFSVSVSLSSTRRRIILASASTDTSECWLIDTNNTAAAPMSVAPRREGIQYFVDDLDDTLVVRTDANGAEDFKLATAPAATPSRWQDLVAYREGCQIEGFVTRAGFIARLEMEDGQQRLLVRDMRDQSEHTVDFDEEAYTLAIGAPFEYGEPIIRLSYGSPVTPLRVYDYDMAQRKLILRREQKVPSGHDPSRYVVRRLLAPAQDGETVPITMVHLKDFQRDGSAPALLTGYGAYATNLIPEFNENVFSLVDRGFVYARAHTRGGMEKGTRWRNGGRLKNKRNTFTDYIAACEHLIREGYTQSGKLIANGASAGGQVVGVAVNMRPELFAGAIAQVPFVDCLTTMLDESLPLTTTDRPEWGDPIADANAYRLIASYAPYENVAAQRYPALFITAGISDPRVTYWEPAKWVAKLRATKRGDSLITLQTRMAAGHFGAPGRFEGQDEIALAYAFALGAVGLREAKPR